MLRDDRFDLRLDRIAIDKSGSQDWANAINGIVPGVGFPGIRPGETFTYRFPIVQSGTCCYHSHMGYQEQKGAYGALIIEPDGEPGPLSRSSSKSMATATARRTGTTTCGPPSST